MQALLSATERMHNLGALEKNHFDVLAIGVRTGGEEY